VPAEVARLPLHQLPCRPLPRCPHSRLPLLVPLHRRIALALQEGTEARGVGSAGVAAAGAAAGATEAAEVGAMQEALPCLQALMHTGNACVSTLPHPPLAHAATPPP
jgi:hypothetical protein